MLASPFLPVPSIDPIVIGADLSDGCGNERSPASVCIDKPLDWRGVARIANGAKLVLSPGARSRIDHARSLVEQIVERRIRAYGVNTGVGALCDVVVSPSEQRALSRNILMSHAVGVGEPLRREETRAIIAAAVNNFAHGHSGVRLELVELLATLLDSGLTPEVPAFGSVGYLSHMAHIALVLIGEGFVRDDTGRMSAASALQRLAHEPLVLEAKEGLSVVNGTPCVTGLASLALARTERLLEWATPFPRCLSRTCVVKLRPSMPTRSRCGYRQGCPRWARACGRFLPTAASLRRRSDARRRTR